MKYYKGFEHTNSTDDEEEIIRLTSTEEEKKTLKRVVITHRLANDTLLTAYIEREKVIDNIRIEASPFNDKPYVFESDAEIPPGESFVLTLKNQSAGSNGGIVGYYEYEIAE